jgi:hypothetical protein
MRRACPHPKTFDVASRARELVAVQPDLRRISNGLEFACVEEVLIVRGQVPTFYLKQVLSLTNRIASH